MAGQHWLRSAQGGAPQPLTPILPGCQEPSIIPLSAPTPQPPSSALRAACQKGCVRTSLPHTSLWPAPQTWLGGLQAAGASGGNRSWGWGCQISQVEGSCTIALEKSPPAPSRGCLHPHSGQSKAHLGRGKRLGTAPEKHLLRDALGSGDTPDQIPVLQRSWPSSPATPSTAAHQPLLKACPEMLSQFAGGWGRGGWVVAPWSQNPHLGLLKPKLSPETPSTLGQAAWDSESQDSAGPQSCKFSSGEGVGWGSAAASTLLLPKPRYDRATAGSLV